MNEKEIQEIQNNLAAGLLVIAKQLWFKEKRPDLDVKVIGVVVFYWEDGRTLIDYDCIIRTEDFKTPSYRTGINKLRNR